MTAEGRKISDIEGFLDGKPLDECLGEFVSDNEKPQETKRALGRDALNGSVHVEDTYSIEIDGLYFFGRQEPQY